MNIMCSGLTRRDFLRGTAGLSLAAALPAFGQEAAAPPEGRSTVVLIRDKAALTDDGQPNGPVLESMLDQAVNALTGESDAALAWKHFMKPDDTVGIKTNGWRFLGTPEPLEKALEQRVIAAGVPEDRVSVDDRKVMENPVFLNSTALINIRPMRTHHWAGVGSLLKNYIMFHENRPSWHEDSCANLAGLWDMPIVKGKTRLNILVMLTPLFHGKGPHHFSAEYTWPYNGLLVGTDPVAVDATGLRILEAKRLEHFGEVQPFPIPPKHIRVAQDKFHLGIADPDRIDLVRLGWDEGVLI